MFAIVVNEKGGEQKRLEFDKPEVTIGRVQGNDIVLPKGNVSKRHSRIVLKDGKFIIVDLKSTNGTYVNGRKITSPLVVKGADKIYIGDFILSIEELLGAQAGEEPSAAPSPARPRSVTLPPPPPGRARPTLQSEPVAEAAEPPESEPEPAERPTRPSQSAVAVPPPPVPPAPVPPARIAVPTPPGRERPASRTDLAAAPRPPAPRPVAAPRPAPRPTPPPRRTTGSVNIDETARQRITDVMRDLSSRLLASLEVTEHDVALSPADELWQRAESTTAQLVQQLSSDGGLPSGLQLEGLSRDVVQETLGNGPLESLLTDDSVREIAVARHDRIFVHRDGAVSLAEKWFSSPDAVERVLQRMLTRVGRGRDLEAARHNGMLVEARVEHGLLLTAVLPPQAARGPAITIRRPRRDLAQLGQLVEENLLSPSMAEFLELAMRGRRNIIVSGPAGSGRSTLLSALARVTAAGERVVSVEETEELQLGEGPWIQLVAGRGKKARDALNNALRLKPERLVVGDLHGAEALDLVGALAAGLEGCICAVQAGSPREALARLQTLARLAPEAPSSEVLSDEIARGVHLLVHLSRNADGELRVVEIAEAGPEGVQTIFAFKADGRFMPSGRVPAWAEGAPPSLFR